MRVTPAKGGRLGASVELTRRARLSVVVLGPNGLVRRVLFRGQAGPGRKAWRWNGRASTSKVVDSGRYSIRVTATNGLGAVSLRESVHVVLATPR
jgi:flagellar hook assembly protein FlgD